MKKLKLAVFDVDGVLLDSMGAWRKVGDELLEKNGIVFLPETRKWIDTLTVSEVAAYLNEHYHLRATDEEIAQEIIGRVENAYFHTIPAKPYLAEMLLWLSAHGVKLCVLTASERHCVEAALERLGVYGYFEKLYTCTEIGLSKYETASFQHVLREMGVDADEAVMFEDSIHALITAKEAGMHTVGVEDLPWNEEKIPQLKEKADWYVNDYRRIPEHFANLVD